MMGIRDWEIGNWILDIGNWILDIVFKISFFLFQMSFPQGHRCGTVCEGWWLSRRRFLAAVSKPQPEAIPCKTGTFPPNLQTIVGMNTLDCFAANSAATNDIKCY